MGRIIATDRFEERQQTALYEQLVEALMDGKFTYEEVEAMRYEIRENCPVGHIQMLYSNDPSLPIEAIDWRRTADGSADVTIIYRNSTTKKFTEVPI